MVDSELRKRRAAAEAQAPESVKNSIKEQNNSRKAAKTQRIARQTTALLSSRLGGFAPWREMF